MEKWLGAAGVCVKKKKVLMVLQGTKAEPKRWSVPSGGLEKGETYEQCCIREIKEETGYDVEIIKPLLEKESPYGKVHYFEVKVTGGNPKIQDPDNLIYQVDWNHKVILKN